MDTGNCVYVCGRVRVDTINRKKILSHPLFIEDGLGLRRWLIPQFYRSWFE